jgi:hypothetical protein
MPCHQECKYHGFLALVEWCRHPDHLEPIEPGRREAIALAGGKCTSWIAWDARVMPGSEPPWPMPVKLQELFPREQPKPRFCTHGAQIQEKEREK